jgi:Delta24(24(1))-sterol reductase
MKGARPINSLTLTPRELHSTFSTRFAQTYLKLLMRWEFGGPWGVTAMMIGFPMLMYYLWICLWFYDGRLVFPTSDEGIGPFINKMWAHIRDVSSPWPRR